MLAAEEASVGEFQIAETITTPAQENLRWLFDPGTLVASRFEIIRPIGRGGMGEVYEACDQVKNISVALKVVLANPAISPETAAGLLRRECSLAQLVSHRNICRIYDPYVHRPADGSPMLVISMELLRGKTLAAALAEHGRLDATAVADIGRQLAAGIDAAHAAGVVHRDLKPSNVMLVEEESQTRAVITDFGLARQAATQTVTQLSKAVAGTLRYMAPEQIEGRTDRRSDLYTFALILFELLTGEFPFTGKSDLALALNRLSAEPKDPASARPGISVAWRSALLRGLSREPQRRFQSASTLMEAIDAPRSGLVLWLGLLVLRARAAPRRVRLAALVVLLSAGIAAIVLPRPASTFPSFSRLLISDLQRVATNDGALLGAGASLTAAVAQSPHLSVVRSRDLAGTLAKMGIRADLPLSEPTVRQLALRSGQNAVLFGSIAAGRRYSLHLRLERMGDSPRRPAAAVERDFQAADSKDLFGTIASAAAWVRKVSGEGVRELNEQNARPEDLTTPSWEALRLLQEARVRRSANDPEGALVFAKEALDLDPEFAAAEAFRADTYGDLRRYKESFDSYKRALEFVKNRNVTGRERYVIEATYDVDIGDDEDSLVTYAAWMTHFPKDYLPRFYSGFLSFHRGDYQKAITGLQSALELDPSQSFILPHLAEAYLAGGQFEQAQRCAVRLLELGENDWSIEVRSLMLLAQHRFDEAATEVAPLASRKQGIFSSAGPRYLASALADSGRLHDAEEALLSSGSGREADSLPGSADRQLEVAFLRWAQGNTIGCRRALGNSVDNMDNPDGLSLAGTLMARLGDLDAARRVLSRTGRWPQVPKVVRAIQRIRAEIALASHAQGADAMLARIQDRVLSGLDLECLLHAARSAGNDTQIARWRKEIMNRKDVLLSWDEHSIPPGIYWMASCQQPCRPR
jgi:tetratricopeptide (TPR) repeat protein